MVGGPGGRSHLHRQGSTAASYEGRRVRLCPARHGSPQPKPLEASRALDRAQHNGQGQAPDGAGAVAEDQVEAARIQYWDGDLARHPPIDDGAKGGWWYVGFCRSDGCFDRWSRTGRTVPRKRVRPPRHPLETDRRAFVTIDTL